jgi:hypothetical protein
MLRNSFYAVVIFTLGIACVGNADVLQDDLNTYGLWHGDAASSGVSLDDNTVMGTVTVTPKRPNNMTLKPSWGNATVAINGSGMYGGCFDLGTDGRQGISFDQPWPAAGTPAVDAQGSEIKIDGWFYIPDLTCLPIPSTAGGAAGTIIADQYWFQISTKASGNKCNLHVVHATPTVGTQKRGEAQLKWLKNNNGSDILLPLYRYVYATGLPLTDSNAINLTGKWIHIVAMAQYTSPAPSWDPGHNRTQLDITDPSIGTTYTVTGANTNTLIGSGVTSYIGMVDGKSGSTPYRAYRGKIDEFRIGMRIHDPMVAYGPTPGNAATIQPTSDLVVSWHKATPYNPADTITQDVWLGRKAAFDPNDPNWTKVQTGFTGTSTSFGPMAMYDARYWKVDSIDSSGGVPVVRSSEIWSFVVDNQPPTVNIGADRNTYLASGTQTQAFAPTVTDNDSTSFTYAWTQIAGPTSAVIASPSTKDTNVTFTEVGSYYFKLVVNDGIDSGEDTVRVQVYSSACAAAQGNPLYTKQSTDFNSDCRVNFRDFATMAANWQKCNSLNPACN